MTHSTRLDVLVYVARFYRTICTIRRSRRVPLRFSILRVVAALIVVQQNLFLAELSVALVAVEKELPVHTTRVGTGGAIFPA